MQVFLENPAVKLICTDGIFVGSKVGSMRVGKKRHLGASGTVNKTYRRMLKGNFVICSSVVFKRDLYDEVGSCDVRYSVVPDYEFFLRCAQVTNFYFIAEGLTKYRIHSANTSRSAMRGCTEVIDVLATAKMKDWRTRLAATYQFGRMLGRLLVLWFGRL